MTYARRHRDLADPEVGVSAGEQLGNEVDEVSSLTQLSPNAAYPKPDGPRIMDHIPAAPDHGSIDLDTLPPVDIPQYEWATHTLLRRARLNIMGDGLEWPSATFEQLPQLREIALVVDDGVRYARLAAQFNFDRFVDATTQEDGPAQSLGNIPDRQRFYTRVTDNGFHVVGVFSAATISGRRRYFQWLTGGWVEIGLSGFLYVRDDLDTHFSEVSAAQLDETQPGATTTAMLADEEWTIERFERTLAPAPVERVESVPPPATVLESAQPLAPEPEPEPVTFAEPEPQPEPEREPEPVAFAEPQLEPVPTTDASPAPAAAIASPASVQHGIAVALATIAHRGATDFAGAAYIDHPARVAERFDAENDPVRHCAAWLHDVLEHSDLAAQDLLDAGIVPDVVEIVSLLTNRDDLSASEHLALIAANPDGLAVKLAALDDNSAPWRLRRLDPATRSRLEQEHAEARELLGVAR
ncbi:hypothetical protein [Leifsonella bigeumensis]|uniref:hypothetical protein n=1 Tax=Leifsonella bigeumensis TaxID=433643 RepID=UPI0031D6FCE2